MLIWGVSESGERRVAEAETRPGEIRLGWDAQDGVHGHIQGAAVRNNQVASRWAVYQALQGVTGAQVQFPLAFASAADALVDMDERWAWINPGRIFMPEAREQAVIPLHPIGIEFHTDVHGR